MANSHRCYVPEILPLHARAKGTAVGISSNWIWNFFVVMITPVILNRLKWKGYLIFMVLNFSFIPLVYFCYPETANLTLEEIDYIFTDDSMGAVKLSKQMRKERMVHGHQASMVGDASDGRRRSLADRMDRRQSRGSDAGTMVAEDKAMEEHKEKV